MMSQPFNGIWTVQHLTIQDRDNSVGSTTLTARTITTVKKSNLYPYKQFNITLLSGKNVYQLVVSVEKVS